MAKFSIVRGMRDLLPKDVEKRLYIVDIIRRMFKTYGYEEVETPVIEYFDLISAKIGEEIRHRMYTFNDLGGRKVALRPEMTAPVARLVATRLRTAPKPLRLGYIANCFRYDNPQMGRYREFWQAGFEIFGSSLPEADAEILIISSDLMKRAGFKNYYFKIGQVGILRGVLYAEDVNDEDQGMIMGLIDKKKQSEAANLLSRLKVSNKCLNVIKRLFKLKGENVEEILKEGRSVLSGYKESIPALENLSDILDLTIKSGVKAPITVDLGFARGLEYYTGMIFEAYVPRVSIALNGGGRYDKLIETFGGEPTPAVGCAPGIDRINLAMEKQNLFPKKSAEKKILVISVNDELSAEALKIAQRLRNEEFTVEGEILGKGIKKALSYANAKGYTFVVIIAPRELKKGNVIVRDMKQGTQKEVPIDEVVEVMRVI